MLPFFAPTAKLVELLRQLEAEQQASAAKVMPGLRAHLKHGAPKESLPIQTYDERLAEETKKPAYHEMVATLLLYSKLEAEGQNGPLH